MTDFPESDWKKLRTIKPKALDRYCRRVLDRLRATLNAPQEIDAHQVYLNTLTMLHSMAESYSKPRFSGTGAIIKVFNN